MTEKLYYKDPYQKEFRSKIKEVTTGNKEIEIILESTAFYPKGGGQPSDTGKILNKDIKLEVNHVTKNNEIKHHCKVLEGNPNDLEEGNTVKGEISWENRYEVMKQHTGQHILSSVFLDELNAETEGFKIRDEDTKIHIKTDKDLSWSSLNKIEEKANKKIWSSKPIKTSFHSEKPENLRKEPPNVNKIRIVETGDHDKVPCGGLHVKNTSEIGLLKISNYSKKSKEKWKIKFNSGTKALKKIQSNTEVLDKMKEKLKVGNNQELEKRIKKLEEQTYEQEKEIKNLKKQNLTQKKLEKEEENIIIERVDLEFGTAQELGKELLNDHEVSIICLVTAGRIFIGSTTPKIQSNELISKTLKGIKGRGGGNKRIAQGGFPEEKTEKAMEKLKETLDKELN